jgi:hypothetical protein
MSQAKKALVTLAGPNMMPILQDYTLPAFERFADAQGYTTEVEEVGIDCLTRKGEGAKQARWKKISAIRKALKNNDLIAWFDADVLIRRVDEDIADKMEDHAFQGLVLHSVPAENRLNPNTGVWVMRNSEQAFDFLDQLDEIGLPDGRWADQAAVMQALGWVMGDERHFGARPPESANGYVGETTWLPIGWNQPYCENRPNPQAYIGRPTVEDPNAVHFMAMTIEERRLVMGSILRQAREGQEMPQPADIAEVGSL